MSMQRAPAANSNPSENTRDPQLPTHDRTSSLLYAQRARARELLVRLRCALRQRRDGRSQGIGVGVRVPWRLLRRHTGVLHLQHGMAPGPVVKPPPPAPAPPLLPQARLVVEDAARWLGSTQVRCHRSWSL